MTSPATIGLASGLHGLTTHPTTDRAIAYVVLALRQFELDWLAPVSRDQIGTAFLDAAHAIDSHIYVTPGRYEWLLDGIAPDFAALGTLGLATMPDDGTIALTPAAVELLSSMGIGGGR